jgi:hypothetical protein
LKDVRLSPQLLEPRFGRRSFVFATPFDSPSITYRLFGFRGAAPFYLLPRRGALEDYYSNPEIFAVICEGTAEIAASVDPSACRWMTIPISRDELAARQWALLEELQRAKVPLDASGASFGRRTYTYIEGVLGGTQTGGYEIQALPRLEVINGSATITVIQLP